MLHPVLPDIEIGMSKQSVALMISKHGHITPYQIKPKNGFFVINAPAYVGLHIINDKYRFMWNDRTAIYFYSEGNMTPIHPLMIDELNRYKKSNGLVQITRKDIEDGIKIRHIATRLGKTGGALTNDERIKIYNEVSQERKVEGEAIQQAITFKNKELQNHIQERKVKHGQDVEYTPEQRAIMMIEYVFDQGLIEKQEHDLAIWKVENGKMSLDSFLTTLKNRSIVSVAEPLPEEIDDFLQDFQMQSERDVASFLDDHRTTRKGLKQYRQPIIKQWISSLLIASLIIVPTVIPLAMALIGFINMFDLRYLALGGIALIIIMGRYHFPLTLPPVALVFYPNNSIKPQKMSRFTKIFILNTLLFRNVYALNSKLRLLWGGKIPCYMFRAENSPVITEILQETEILVKRRKR